MPIQTRKFKVLISTLPARTRSGSKKRMVQQAAKRRPKTTFKVSISIYFRSDFATVLCAPCHACVHLGDVLYDIQYPRSIRLLRVASPFDSSIWRRRRRRPAPLGFPIVLRTRSIIPLPSPIPSNDDRSTNHSLEPVTPLSNSEALVMLKTPTTTCTFPAIKSLPLR